MLRYSACRGRDIGALFGKVKKMPLIRIVSPHLSADYLKGAMKITQVCMVGKGLAEACRLQVIADLLLKARKEQFECAQAMGFHHVPKKLLAHLWKIQIALRYSSTVVVCARPNKLSFCTVKCRARVVRCNGENIQRCYI